MINWQRWAVHLRDETYTEGLYHFDKGYIGLTQKKISCFQSLKYMALGALELTPFVNVIIGIARHHFGYRLGSSFPRPHFSWPEKLSSIGLEKAEVKAIEDFVLTHYTRLFILAEQKQLPIDCKRDRKIFVGDVKIKKIAIPKLPRRLVFLPSGEILLVLNNKGELNAPGKEKMAYEITRGVPLVKKTIPAAEAVLFRELKEEKEGARIYCVIEGAKAQIFETIFPRKDFFSWPEKLSLIGLKESEVKAIEDFVLTHYTRLFLMASRDELPVDCRKEGKVFMGTHFLAASEIPPLPRRMLFLPTGEIIVVLNRKGGLSPVGSGLSGQIKLAYEIRSGTRLVKKKVSDAAEAQVLNQLKGKEGIAKIYCVVEGRKFQAFEKYFMGKDLAVSIHLIPKIGIIDRIYRYAIQLLSGLKAIHAATLFHGDIKPENIVIEKDAIVITDFLDIGKNLCYTPAYSCPSRTQYVKLNEEKRITSNEQDDFEKRAASYDIWAMGLIFFQLLYYNDLLGKKDIQAFMQQVILNSVVLLAPLYNMELLTVKVQTVWDKINEKKGKIDQATLKRLIWKRAEALDPKDQTKLHALWGVMYAMLEEDPEQRPTAEECLRMLKNI